MTTFVENLPLILEILPADWIEDLAYEVQADVEDEDTHEDIAYYLAVALDRQEIVGATLLKLRKLLEEDEAMGDVRVNFNKALIANEAIAVRVAAAQNKKSTCVTLTFSANLRVHLLLVEFASGVGNSFCKTSEEARLEKYFFAAHTVC